MNDFPDPWRDLGEFIREQRNVARLSVRRLSDMAGISNPYLSQIERGLRRPSAEILQQIARALEISAETLYVRAGILDAREAHGDLTEAIVGEATLSDDQKQTLLRIYRSFRRENAAATAGPDSASPVPPDPVPAGPVPAGPVTAGPVPTGPVPTGPDPARPKWGSA
jgi:transcriptional regulator with XRE-family HTH domain